jgi:hypothetical protein
MRGVMKLALLALGATALGLGLASGIGFVRLGGGALSASMAAAVERGRALAARARPEYQEVVLAALPPNPLNGDYLLLENRLEGAVMVEAPPGVEGESGIVFGLEFEDPAAPGLAAVGSLATTVDDGALVVTNGSGTEADHLVTPEAIRISPGEIGDILIRAKITHGEFFRLGWLGEQGRQRQSQGGGTVSTSGSRIGPTSTLTSSTAERCCGAG